MATAIPTACLASSAIRGRDVETGPNLGVLAVFPSNGAPCRCPLPSTGSRGLNSPASAVSGRRRRPPKGSPPSAAQTVRAVFRHTAFTRVPVAERWNPAPARGRGRQWPDTARLCAAAHARATDTTRPAIVAHAATGRADAAEHEHAPGPAAGACRKAGCHSPAQGHTRPRGVAERSPPAASCPAGEPPGTRMGSTRLATLPRLAVSLLPLIYSLFVRYGAGASAINCWRPVPNPPTCYSLGRHLSASALSSTRPAQ